MSYTFSQAFWEIATDMTKLMIPCFSIGITFYLIKEIITEATRGGR